MKQKNKYAFHSHISEKKFREIIKCFSLDITNSRQNSKSDERVAETPSIST